MARIYSIPGEQNVPATAGSSQADASIVGLVAATTCRASLYGLTFGCSGTPSDQAYTIQIARFTATGTATTITPRAADPLDTAAATAGRSNWTAAPTYTASSELLSVDIHQRATFSWIEDPSRGFIVPATASNGLGLFFAVATGGTPLCHATMIYQEQ